MKSAPELSRLIELQRLLQVFNEIDRVTHRKHADDMRPENDTEHSYNLAMTAWFLADHFPELDTSTLIKLALVHDLVEIYAGDTYVYGDPALIASKKSREADALVRLQKEWPDFAPMLELLESYENRDTAEARFIYALDKIMPIMQIYIHDGYTWRKEGITLKKLDGVKADKVALSPEIRYYYDQLYELLLSSPEIIPTE